MREQRNEALYRQFKETWKRYPSLNYDQVIELVLKSPQPRMWAGFISVYNRLRRILYNSKKELTVPAKSGLEKEVLEKYNKLIQQPIFRKASPYFLTSFIIAEPSTGFYISPAYAKRIVWRTCKKHKADAKS